MFDTGILLGGAQGGPLGSAFDRDLGWPASRSRPVPNTSPLQVVLFRMEERRTECHLAFEMGIRIAQECNGKGIRRQTFGNHGGPSC